jgi:uncharacterized coiled-coil DUF342 family protein
MESEKGVEAEKIIKTLLEELERIRKKINEIEDYLDSAIDKVDDSELKEELDFIYMELEDLIIEIKKVRQGQGGLWL